MSGFPPPCLLTSHRAPALLVDELLEAAADGSAARTRLLNSDGLDLLQLIEGCAQTVAVLMGSVSYVHGGTAADIRGGGMLVGVTEAVMEGDIPAGAAVEAAVVRTYELPPFSLFQATVTCAGRTVATLDIKTMALPP